MEGKIPKGTQCHECQKEIKIGDEGVGYFKKTGNYLCGECMKNFAKTETYSRVVGYMRPIQRWNDGKRQEWEDRKEFKI